jgi:hypothetical protein
VVDLLEEYYLILQVLLVRLKDYLHHHFHHFRLHYNVLHLRHHLLMLLYLIPQKLNLNLGFHSDHYKAYLHHLHLL